MAAPAYQLSEKALLSHAHHTQDGPKKNITALRKSSISSIKTVNIRFRQYYSQLNWSCNKFQRQTCALWAIMSSRIVPIKAIIINIVINVCLKTVSWDLYSFNLYFSDMPQVVGGSEYWTVLWRHNVLDPDDQTSQMSSYWKPRCLIYKMVHWK